MIGETSFIAVIWQCVVDIINGYGLGIDMHCVVENNLIRVT